MKAPNSLEETGTKKELEQSIQTSSPGIKKKQENIVVSDSDSEEKMNILVNPKPNRFKSNNTGFMLDETKTSSKESINKYFT